jgi:hypothetical protein
MLSALQPPPVLLVEDTVDRGREDAAVTVLLVFIVLIVLGIFLLL